MESVLVSRPYISISILIGPLMSTLRGTAVMHRLQQHVKQAACLRTKRAGGDDNNSTRATHSPNHPVSSLCVDGPGRVLPRGTSGGHDTEL